MITVIIPTKGDKDLSGLIQELKRQKVEEILVEVDLEGNVSKARNKGAMRSQGDLLVFLDDDIILSPNFIQKGIEGMERYDFGQSRVIGGIENNEDKFTATACWFSRDALDALKGFNEDFIFFNEDIDIYLRAIEMKLNYIYLYESVAWHPSRGNFERLQFGNRTLRTFHPKEYNKIKKELR